MDDKEKLILDQSVEAPGNANAKKVSRNAKLPWYFATGFLMFWGLLFFAVVLPYFYRLPTPLTLEDVGNNVFIAERAYNNLYTLSNIGIKLSGTDKNEVEAVNFLLSELDKIKENMNNNLFDLEIDLFQSSGLFVIKTFHRVYQGIQNIAVKISPKNSTSETYLLINSHFDSESGPGAGDAGFMIVTMMEVLRVIATSKQPIQHPIVFLFNGGEEGGLQASHGFITTHRWAPLCKAVINLDAAGSGGRDILFQSGPNHPWLVEYYKKYIKHPFATTMAEEIFQAGLIPSDTDFRQFKTYGQIPGLDMAQCINGFVYHTRYDTIDVIPRGSLQNTGNNILGLVRGLANATELNDTEAHKTGHAVFFDFLGIYFFHYSEATGEYLNFGVGGAALLLIILSMWRMAAVSNVSLYLVINWLILVTVIQIISFALGIVLPLVVAYTMDSYGLTLTYYSTPVLIIGLYVCPSLIGLSLPLTIYFSLQCRNKISAPYHLQLALHGQAIILAVLSIVVTYLGYRSAYIFVIPLVFYVVALALNLMTILHDLGYAWTGLLKVSQVVPFLYSSYLFYTFIVVMRPMAGRSGSGTNQDLYIAFLSGLGTVLSFGFLVPLINTFRRPSSVIFFLVASTGLTVYLASSTQLGFPYRPKTNTQRISYLDVRNIYYDFDGTISKDESGYLMLFQDRRRETPLVGSNVNTTGMISLASACEKQMMCGMPLYDNRFVTQRLQSFWIPRSEPIVPPIPATLLLLSKTLVNGTTVRYEFSLTGPTIMRLFIKAEEDVTISNWSFLRTYLENPPPAPIPHQIYLKYFTDDTPFKFFFELYKPNRDYDVPLFELGVSAHYTAYDIDAKSKEFADSFPSYAFLDHWPAFYQRYYF
ncbi:endoplasmic reticulum metallopeptidase 1-like [Drosophila albomicans]|uniref:FXNA-like protease n=1 Tax=Drosophila albomicans TaxID=7291 RepID=A0A6P8Z1D2_DROAB|nr:endoplasmic reticulum metallopeptidase 1-like [Drosophila albomicans]